MAAILSILSPPQTCTPSQQPFQTHSPLQLCTKKHTQNFSRTHDTRCRTCLSRGAARRSSGTWPACAVRADRGLRRERRVFGRRRVPIEHGGHTGLPRARVPPRLQRVQRQGEYEYSSLVRETFSASYSRELNDSLNLSCCEHITIITVSTHTQIWCINANRMRIDFVPKLWRYSYLIKEISFVI